LPLGPHLVGTDKVYASTAPARTSTLNTDTNRDANSNPEAYSDT